mgnify:CR=1 FL=1
MNEQKIAGTWNDTSGKVKEGVGELTGDGLIDGPGAGLASMPATGERLMAERSVEDRLKQLIAQRQAGHGRCS